MDLNYKKITDEELIEKITETDKVFVNIDGKVRQTTVKKLVSAVTPTDIYTKTEVDKALNDKQDALTFDETPTEGSVNPVTSGGIFAALAGAGGIDVIVSPVTIVNTRVYSNRSELFAYRIGPLVFVCGYISFNGNYQNTSTMSSQELFQLPYKEKYSYSIDIKTFRGVSSQYINCQCFLNDSNLFIITPTTDYIDSSTKQWFQFMYLTDQ